MRSSAILGQFSLGGCSILIFVDCKLSGSKSGLLKEQPSSWQGGTNSLSPKVFFNMCLTDLSSLERDFSLLSVVMLSYSCWGVRALNLPTTPSIGCIKVTWITRNGNEQQQNSNWKPPSNIQVEGNFIFAHWIPSFPPPCLPASSFYP